MKVLDKLTQILRNRNYSKNTIDTYICYLDKYFIEEKIKDPYQISLAQVKHYLQHKEYSSISQQNQIIGALKLFCKYMLGKKAIHLDKIERPRKEKKLPKVIEGELLKEKILAIQNLKHKAILSLAFSCALRVSEVINLKMVDIDRQRMIINIKNAKGKKDRIVKLSAPLLQILEDYYKAYKPKTYLFNGQFSLQYSASSCNKLMKKYIGSETHFHLLRHSSATLLHEKGLDIMVLSKLLGHSSVKTTQIYTHISNRVISNIEMAL